MSGSLSKKDTIKKGILIAKQCKTTTSEKVTAMIYTLADKFLTGTELEEIKAVSYTHLSSSTHVIFSAAARAVKVKYTSLLF